MTPQLGRSSDLAHGRRSDDRPADLGRCRLRVAAALVGTAALLAGCRVGPDFLRPPSPPISCEFAEAAQNETEAYDDLVYWWSHLNDPVLNWLIAEGCRQNLDLREAFYRIAVARARLGVVRADRLPQADAVGDYAYRDFAENATQFISSTAGNRGFSFHRLGFDTRWEIDLFGKIARSIEAASAELGGEIESYRDVKVTLLAEIASTYIQLRLAQARTVIARDNLAAQQRTLRIVRDRRDSGLVSPLDVAQAESNVHRTAATIPELLQLETVAINQLAFLLGRTPDEPLRERLATAPLPVQPPEVAVGVPADLLTRRPDIRQAERQVAAASARIGVAVAEKYPQMSILGTISVEARDVDMLFSPGSLAHSVGPAVRWNILNFGQLNNIIAGRSAELRVAVVNYQREVLSAVQEVEDGLVALHRQTERADHLRQAVAATQRAVSSSQVRYERGLIGFQPVLDSQREALSAEDALAGSRAQALLGLVRIYKALGGGWESQCGVQIAAEDVDSGSNIGEPEALPSAPPELPAPTSMPSDLDPLTRDRQSPAGVAPMDSAVAGPAVIPPPQMLQRLTETRRFADGTESPLAGPQPTTAPLRR